MEKKEIIESGMLERYLLGELGPEEVGVVEDALASDTDLATQYTLMEKDLETVARENAIAPPELVKDRVLRSIEIDPVKDLQPSKKSFQGGTIMALAASLALLFLLSSIWLYQKADRLETDLELVQRQKQELEIGRELDETIRLKLEEQLATLRNADTEKYVLRGNQRSPRALAVGYINHREQKVLLDHSGLPKLPAGKTYQLWGDVNGEMIDMGIVPKSPELAEMHYLENAESLNITIEPEGGSAHPTVSQLIGNVYLKPTTVP